MGYTEEEMHELEILTLLREKDFDHNTCDNSYIDLVMKSGKKAFKIIKKQQKEIEKQASLIKFDVKYRNQLEQDLYENASNYVISKEKIKNKIKELENIEIDYDNLILQGDKILFAIRILEELIGIEPRKEFWKEYKQ